jgi:hypothetical protein
MNVAGIPYRDQGFPPFPPAYVQQAPTEPPQRAHPRDYRLF